jgi:hypothetical protein
MNRRDVSAGTRLTRVSLWLAAGVVLLYGADALYPTWDWSCSARSLGDGLVAGPNRIPELEQDPTARVLRPSIPEGCTAHAHNAARNVVDWLTR